MSTVVGDRLPASCDRCESPFFWYKRVTYRYVLTDDDRAFLRAGGIAPDEPVRPESDRSDQSPTGPTGV